MAQKIKCIGRITVGHLKNYANRELVLNKLNLDVDEHALIRKFV